MNSAKYQAAMALREHMLSGHAVSLIEAILLFGVQNPNAEFTRMKNDGFLIKAAKVPMSKIMRRINEYTICKPPGNLPIKEIILTEYWVSR